MKRYLVMTFRRPGFDDGLIAPHLTFLDELRAQDRLEMTGGFSDKSGGAYLLRADSLEEAQAIAGADPLNTGMVPPSLSTSGTPAADSSSCGGPVPRSRPRRTEPGRTIL